MAHRNEVEDFRHSFIIHYGSARTARGAKVVEEASSLNFATVLDLSDDICEVLMAATGRTIDGDIPRRNSC